MLYSDADASIVRQLSCRDAMPVIQLLHVNEFVVSE